MTDDGLHVRVLVPGGTGSDWFARSIADADESVGGDIDTLLALAQLRQRRSIDRPGLGILAQRSATEAQTVLDRLVLSG